MNATTPKTNGINPLHNAGVTASDPLVVPSTDASGSAGEAESAEPNEDVEKDLSIAPTSVAGLIAPFTTNE